MTLTEKMAAIEALVAEMKQLTLQAGVPVETFNKILDADQLLTDEDLDNRLDFLKRTQQKEYFKVFDIQRLLPDTVWKRYEEFGEYSLREQRLLREARKELRKVWRKRYGEKEPASESNDNQESLSC